MTFIDLAATLVLAAAFAGGANAADRSGDGEPAFRALYKELVETQYQPFGRLLHSRCLKREGPAHRAGNSGMERREFLRL